MRKKYSPKQLEVEGNVLRALPAEAFHLIGNSHPAEVENANFEELLRLRYELELRRAQRHALRHLPSPTHLMEQRTAKPVTDPRYGELSLTTVRSEQHRRLMRSKLSVR